MHDVRFALRLLVKDRWLSAAAVVVLALGIGANATGFTVLNAVFFRGLPFDAADRLRMLSWQQRSGRRADVSLAELQDWRDQSRTFHSLAGFSETTMNISGGSAWPEAVQGSRVTANTFGVLRQRPLFGRDFAVGEDRVGAEPAVIIGASLWKNRYGADPQVLGKTLRVDGVTATIIGVMPEQMRFPENSALWVAFIPTAAEQQRQSRPLSVVGRLRDGPKRGEAEAELRGIGQRLLTGYPEVTQDFVGVRVETLTEALVGGSARPLFMAVMGAAIFVLLIACANVANLLLSRSASRAREIAVRMAMGASRSRIIRQLLIESGVLGVLGGGIGSILATGGVRAFNAAMQTSGMPYWMSFTVDYVVFAYVAAICLLTAVLFGIAPALHVSHANNHEVLKDAGRGITAHRRARWFSSAMVIAELALTIVLLAGAGLMLRSFLALSAVDTGVRADHLMTMRLQLPASKYPEREARRGFFASVEPRLGAIAGVQSVAITTGVPPFDGGERRIQIERIDAPSRLVSTVAISPRFFEVVDVPLVRGRSFDSTDGEPGKEAVIINERLAAQFFPGDDPIGRRLRFVQQPERSQPATPGADALAASPALVWRTVVGISGRILHGSPQDGYQNAVVYIPHRQESPGTVSLLVRSALAPSATLEAVRREVQSVDPDQPVRSIQTLDQVLAEDRWPFRTFGALFGVFAFIALTLSATGLYAVMAHSVTQRTTEIGVRLAIGAQRRQVSWLILSRGLRQLAIGLAIGLLGALALSRVIERILVIPAGDPITYVVITFLLTVVSIAACLLPAQRATRVDPVIALRAD